jgi:hypothetical protein
MFAEKGQALLANLFERHCLRIHGYITSKSQSNGFATRTCSCAVGRVAIRSTLIGSEKDVDRRLLGTREMEGIIGTKPQRLQCLRTGDSDIRQRDRVLHPAEHLSDTGPSCTTGRIVDFFLHHGTTEPLPCTGLAVPQDQENRFGFQGGYGLGADRQTGGLSSRHQGRYVVSVWILPYRPLFGFKAAPAFPPDNVITLAWLKNLTWHSPVKPLPCTVTYSSSSVACRATSRA